MRIGVLALQGGFAEHRAALQKLKADSFDIRQKKDLSGVIDGLILPGGESTVIGRLLRQTELFEPLKEMIAGGLSVFGTCAGMILLADKIDNDPDVYFRSIAIAVRRNAYGRQLGSFSTTGIFSDIGEIPMTFIRAPYISSCGSGVRILAAVDGIHVAAERANVLVTAFHPELTDDLRVHRYFLSKVSSCFTRA
jgi:5'-phosphate synthase pdxT subunit